MNMACKNVADIYGSYGNVIDAKKACEADPNCGKVCDKYCNGVTLTLCTKGSDVIDSPDGTSIGACLYVHDRDSKNKKTE